LPKFLGAKKQEDAFIVPFGTPKKQWVSLGNGRFVKESNNPQTYKRNTPARGRFDEHRGSKETSNSNLFTSNAADSDYQLTPSPGKHGFKFEPYSDWVPNKTENRSLDSMAWMKKRSL